MLTVIDVLNILLVFLVMAVSASLVALSWSRPDVDRSMRWLRMAIGCLYFLIAVVVLTGSVPDLGISISLTTRSRLLLLLYAGIALIYFLVAHRLPTKLPLPRIGQSLWSWQLTPAFLAGLGMAVALIREGSGFALDLLLILLAVALEVRRIPPLAVAANSPDLAVQKQRELSGVLSDLAQERKEKESLKQDLQVAERYKQDFLSNMSHELRTPLNAIIGYSDLLHSGVYGELNEKQMDRVERILQNGNHLLEIVSDILDLSQLDTSKVYLQVEAIKLEPLINQIIDSFEGSFKSKSLIARVESAPLPHVFGDPAQVSRIIENLIDNAIRFTNQGEVVVRLKPIEVRSGSAQQLELPAVGWLHDGHWVVIQIADTGIGIEPEDQASIFDEFFQVDSGQARTHGGTGVGLAVVKKLVDLHSGSIWLKSTPGSGSEFSVALPADVIQSDE